MKRESGQEWLVPTPPDGVGFADRLGPIDDPRPLLYCYYDL